MLVCVFALSDCICVVGILGLHSWSISRDDKNLLISVAKCLVMFSALEKTNL